MAEEHVYNRIALLRTDRGISRRQLAEAMGVHYQTIGYLERGEYSPSLSLALHLARYFNVPVESLFSLEEFPPAQLRPGCWWCWLSHDFT